MLADWIRQMTGADADAGVADAGIERVCALLLMEIARADHCLDAAEIDSIHAELADATALSEQEIQAIVAEVQQEADALVSLHAHVAEINRQLDRPARIALVERMWRVAAADGQVDADEEHRIRRLSDMIHVRHREFMQAKHRALA